MSENNQPTCNPNSHPTPTIIPKNDLTHQQNLKYFQEFKILLQTSQTLQQQLVQQYNLKRSLFNTLNDLQVKMSQIQTIHKHFQRTDSNAEKPKRMRRTNNMINKIHKCPVEKCQKIYGSEGSLNQHLKIKHPQQSVQQRTDMKEEESVKQIV